MVRPESPFEPGKPVSPYKFVGRENQLAKIDRYLGQASSGRHESFFLVGERGLGKTSIAKFVANYAENEHQMIPSHSLLGGVHSMEEMVRLVFDGLLNQIKDEPWYNKVKGLFGDYIEEVGLFGVTLKFNPPKPKLEALIQNFPGALLNLITKIQKYDKHKKGLVIILDDINGTVDDGRFANWFKSMIDSASVTLDYFPVFFILIGLPRKRDQLFRQQPSLMRIFKILEIEKLSNLEVKEFYLSAFQEVNFEVENSGLEIMVSFSMGLPIVMQEIGDAVFWVDRDHCISEDDVLPGILEASENIGKKYLDTTFYNTVRSVRYKSIVRKIGGGFGGVFFTKKEISNSLSDDEKKVFDNLLRKLRELGIVDQAKNHPRGTYRFTNALYPLYFSLKSRS